MKCFLEKAIRTCRLRVEVDLQRFPSDVFLATIIFQVITSTVIAFTVFVPSAWGAEISEPIPNWSYVERKLNQNDFSPVFVREMQTKYEKREFTEVLRLNILLFLKKADYHGPQVTDGAVDEVRRFMVQNKVSLERAERLYGVAPQVISSLLWIESRHGRNKGTFHVPSVYLHLIQGERPPVLNFLRKEAKKFSDNLTADQKKQIHERAKKRAKWALEELRALYQIRKWKWEIGSSFRGSFSGAFGMAQFIPSSYVKWSRPYRQGEQPDLSKPEDAIESAAFYLKDHGWKAGALRTHEEALFKYNNSRDYARAILELANRSIGVPKLKSDLSRIPAKE